jgi:hypothetical protein
MLYLFWAGWGLIGGLIVEALDLSGAIRREGTWPWRVRGEPKLGPYLAAVVLRVGAGAGLAAGLGGEGQLGGPLSALVVGAGAPLILERITKQAFLTVPSTHGDEPARPPARRRAPRTRAANATRSED